MKIILPLLAMLVLHVPGLAAQTSLAAPMDPRLIVAPAEHAAVPALADARRDHAAGAIKGFALGALVGGVGFALVTSAANDGGDAGGYAVLALPVGAVVGGALGLVVGAIVGLPEKDGARRS